MADDYKVLVGIDVTDAGAEKQVDDIVKRISGKNKKIKILGDLSDVKSQLDDIEKQIDAINKKQIKLPGSGGGGRSGGGGGRRGNGNNQDLENYRELIKLQTRYNSLATKRATINFDPSKASRQIKELDKQLDSLSQRMNALTANTKFTNAQRSNIQFKRESRIGNVAIINQKIADKVNNKNADFVQDVKFKFDTKELELGVVKAKDSMSNLGSVSNTTKTAVSNLEASYKALDNALKTNNVDQIKTAYESFTKQLKQANNELEINKKNNDELSRNKNLEINKKSLNADIEIWSNKNSLAAKVLADDIKNIKNQIETADGTKLAELRKELRLLQQQAKAAGLETKTFGDQVKEQFSKLASVFTVATLFTQGVRMVREMYKEVVAVDTAMTSLYRVTDLTSSQYDKLYTNMTNSAKKYGASLSELIQSTADWVKLGFDTSTANRLAEITTMYQHVTDLDNSTAVTNLVTAYKGFEDSLLESSGGDRVAAMEKIADIYDKLGNEFAESAADVGEGMQKSAAVLNEAGASIEESVGMFTAAQEVMQNASTVGNALKIYSLRIRGMKGQLEELGEEVDENVESISKMQTQILNITKGKVNIFDDNGEFRNIYEITKDIADVYDDLSSTDRASLLELIAGKNRSVSIQAMLENWKQAEKAVEAAFNSAGTAVQENDKYLESINGKLSTLKATWQALSNDFLQTDVIKGGIGTLTKIVDVFDSLVKDYGSGAVAAGAFGIVSYIQSIS